MCSSDLVDMALAIAELRHHASTADAILRKAAQRFAEQRESTEAVACAVAADLCGVQRYLLDNLRPAGSRQYFSHAQSWFHGKRSGRPPVVATALDYVAAYRDRLLELAPPNQAEDVAAVLVDHSYLAPLPSPTVESWQAHRTRRLGDQPSGTFVRSRLSVAHRLLLQAQQRVIATPTEIDEAIQEAYRADAATLEAYLVESATAAGDTYLISVIYRWELAAHALRTEIGRAHV